MFFAHIIDKNVNSNMKENLSNQQISEILDEIEERSYVNPPDVDADSGIDPDDPPPEEPAEEIPEALHALGLQRAPKKDKWGYIDAELDEEEEGDRGQEGAVVYRGQEGEAGDSTDSNFTISYDPPPPPPPTYKPRIEGLGLGGTQGYDRGDKRQMSETTSGGEDLDPRVRITNKRKVLTKKSPRKVGKMVTRVSQRPTKVTKSLIER